MFQGGLGGGVITIILQYLAIFAFLIALFLILRDLDKLPSFLNAASSLNTNAILAFKAA